METLKNLLRPGHKEDDQTLYDTQTSGTTSNTANTNSPSTGLTGEGSHLAGGNSNVTSQSHGTHESSGLTGQGSHLGSSSGGQYPINSGVDQSNTHSSSDNSRLTGNDTLGSSASRGHAGEREYDPQGSATTRGITTAGSHNKTYKTPESTTVGPSTTSGTASQGVGSDLSKSTASGLVGGSNTHGNSHANTTSGPHGSDNLNRLDPRVDSDNSRSAQSGLVGGSNPHGSSHTTATSGPHGSDNLNRLDPRVDSDNSRSAQSGLVGATGGSSNTHNSAAGHAGSTGDGYSSSTGGSYHTGPIGSSVGGPHSTFTANLLDPNLDQNSTVRQENAIRHDAKHGGGAEQADHDHSTTARTAGEGAVGLGALGLGSAAESRFTNQGTSEVNREGHSLADSSTFGSIPQASASSSDYTGATTQHSSGIPDRTRGADQTTTSSSDSHNYGRDATILGGGAGLAGAAYGAKHHSDHQTSSTHQSTGSTIGDKLHGEDRNRGVSGDPIQAQSTQDRSHNIMTGSSSMGNQPSGTTTSSTTRHSSNILNTLDPRVSNDQQQEGHSGRNAAIGGAALGAAGAGYGASRHHDSQNPVQTSNRDTTTLGSSGVGSQNVQNDQSYGHTSQDGRTGIPGAGAGGFTGANTARVHDNQNYSSGPHSSDLANRVDPRVDSDRSKDHSHGRDAALVGGAGAAGYGAHRLHDNSTHSNIHDSSNLPSRGLDSGHSDRTNVPASSNQQTYKPHTSTTTTTTTNTSTTTAGPHSSNLANRADPRIDSDRSTEKETHHGRDAAILGGVGTAAYAAHQGTNDRDDEAEKMRRLGEEERAKQHREHEKFVEKEEKHSDKHEKKEHKGLFSFLHRDKSKKYTKEEEDEFDRQEKEHHSHQKTAAASGVGAGSYAAHETHAHNQHATQEKPVGSSIGDKLHGVERNRGVVGDNPYPDGGGPKDGINEVTGQPFESSVVRGEHTIGTDGHHGHLPGTGNASGVTTNPVGTSTSQYGNVAGSTATDTTSSSHHDRNRLHKDPPAGHPASQY